MNHTQLTDCECEEAGWCERHQCEKADFWHRLCRRDLSLYLLWEQGRGPLQVTGTKQPGSRSPCIHRGDHVRSEACATCPGGVRIKVFRCPVHTECSMTRHLPSVAVCEICNDYESNNESPEESAKSTINAT